MGHLTPLTWNYQMAEVLPNLVKAIEFHKISPNSLIRVVSSQEVTFSPACHHSIRVLFQEKHEVPFIMVKDFSALPNLLYYGSLTPTSSTVSPAIRKNGIGKRHPLGELALL